METRTAPRWIRDRVKSYERRRGVWWACGTPLWWLCWAGFWTRDVRHASRILSKGIERFEYESAAAESALH